jgi:outer membrane protein assembly factor BamE (lipoprotein component of BamABCDE complex)
MVIGADPPPTREPFSARVSKVKVGTSRARVLELLGPPEEQPRDAKQWTYRDPPHRPDGPYHSYTFTFEAGKVTRVDESGVGCVLNE